ncbi:non-specific lipid-transfer protein 2G-like [Andrographis paniculata]|uniref:non-specific lipid-transfer protein 2G-like n=1 Tax=Andrographis paniculata TaxID=175694 RepID=UPI0021E7711D|nr:non-specific lipid-transfer protein 2G-like [Andrographis paniculata]
MMMKKVVITMVVLAAVVAAAAAQTPPVSCDPQALSSCASAIIGFPPSRTCCDGLRLRQHCFCEYLNDPDLQQYFTPEVAQRLAAACRVTVPTNC